MFYHSQPLYLSRFRSLIHLPIVGTISEGSPLRVPFLLLSTAALIRGLFSRSDGESPVRFVMLEALQSQINAMRPKVIHCQRDQGDPQHFRSPSQVQAIHGQTTLGLADLRAPPEV